MIALKPETGEEARRVLAECGALGRSLRIRGGGAFIDLGGARPEPDAVLDTTKLKRVVFYEPQELTIKAECGISVAELAARLKEHGQELPWDEPWPERQTLGGVIAAALSGPRRLAGGPVRDQVLGVKLALTDGRIIQPGGRVVKNVAGYDVTRLIVGSRGSLGLILEAALLVRPRPEERWAFSVRLDSPKAIFSALNGVWDAALSPCLLEVRADANGRYLLIGCEGFVEEVAPRRERVRAMLGKAGATREFRADEVGEILAAWAREMWETPGPVFRVSVPKRRVKSIVEGALEAGHAAWVRAGSGVVFVLPGADLKADEARGLLDSLGERAAMLGGVAVQERGPLASPEADGKLPARVVALNRSLRRIFDPAGILSDGER